MIFDRSKAVPIKATTMLDEYFKSPIQHKSFEDRKENYVDTNQFMI
jgi:hypothetical protein